jgi:hypothetical protein
MRLMSFLPRVDVDALSASLLHGSSGALALFSVVPRSEHKGLHAAEEEDPCMRAALVLAYCAALGIILALWHAMSGRH